MNQQEFDKWQAEMNRIKDPKEEEEKEDCNNFGDVIDLAKKLGITNNK